MNTITCPNCGKEISEAFRLQIEKEIVQKEQEKHKFELENAKREGLENAEKKIKQQYKLQMKQISEDALAKEEQNKKLLEQLTQLTIQLRESRKEKDEAKLEMQKKLMEEEGKIRIDAQKKSEESFHLKMLEKDKQLSDALKANEEMSRKLQQGSTQNQGEVFELEFEGKLKDAFPNDKIKPVEKGVRGADIIQEVWDSRGNYNGKILWELKNTKTPWKEEWITTLKGNQRIVHADDAVIISEVMPKEQKNAGFRNGVWITKQNFALGLASTLRAKLIQIFYIKSSVKGKDDNKEKLYNYVFGVEYKHRVEAIVDAFTGMQVDVEKEKRYFASKWARDEKNIRQVIDSTYGMQGDMKGIVGNSFPQIKGLDEDLISISDGKIKS
jgi:hypothetical protein